MREWILWLLTNPVAGPVIAPIALLVTGGLVKTLIQSDGWRWEPFYLGVEGSLAALSSSITYIFDLAGKLREARAASQPVTSDRLEDALVSLGAFCVLTVGMLLVVMVLHQNWRKKGKTSWARVIWLGGVGNIIGLGLVALFVILIKRGP